MFPVIEQGPKGPGDGPVSVSVDGAGYRISVAQDGVEQTLVISTYNTLRLFAQLSIMLGRALTKKAMKGICL